VAGAPQSTERCSIEESSAAAKISLQDAREAYEARYITQVLAQHGGNVSHAAVALRLSRVALQNKDEDIRAPLTIVSTPLRTANQA